MSQTLTSRNALAALIVIATAAFVIGTALERRGADAHSEPVVAGSSGEQPEAGEVQGSEAGLEEGAGESGAAHSETGTEPAGVDEQVLGVDVEGTPFVALAVVVSLLLAAGVVT